MNKIRNNNNFQIEIIIYYLIWTGGVLYSIYCFAKTSNNFFQDYNDEYSDFNEGWLIRTRKIDSADYEWKSLKFFLKKIYLWIIVLIGISEILRQLKQIKILVFFQLLTSFIFILYEFGLIPLILILLQPLLFFIIGNFRKTYLIWVCNIFCLFSMSYLKNLITEDNFLKTFTKTGNEQETYLIILAIFWMNLKCTHYALHNLLIKSKNFFQLLSYCFYLPTIFTGPFITYDNYEKCLKKTGTNSLKNRLTNLFFDLIRFTFWLVFVEFALHFIYVNATSFQPQLVETFDSWSLYGYGYTMGQFFHMKYVVMYGLSTTIAKFEKIPTPTLPKCIGRIHLYSDMWKYFDRGLYDFLLKHIYLPSITNKLLRNNKFIASFLCFTFVYVWHGLETYIFIWTLMNFIGIVIEDITKTIYNKYLKNLDFCQNKLNDVWLRRLTCLIASPLLAMSAISNFYFFARTTIGHIFINRFFHDEFYSTCILLMILYCCCQISTELRQKSNSRDKIR